ncbi:class I SAM-dependent methyltransferase [Pseudomonas sp. YH-1]|uniref:class I SAM-dependent methyltransferase n=1 Tax=Pseudomonas sp. YH-1 TaxID=3384787 RepID=UPI003F816F09
MLSEVINPARYDDQEWMRLHEELETYSVDKHVFFTEAGHIYRKSWEWTHCLYGLGKSGVIAGNAKALGVGAGREPVIFWLADRIGEVVATDLYGNEEWSAAGGKEASSEVITDTQKFCPRPINLTNIKFENANGTALPYADDSFDFCWSLSSIEHFGGHENSAQAMREMVRVVRPGGIVCVATELMLLDEHVHPEFFTQRQFQKYIIDATTDATLIDGMNWALPPLEYLIDSVPINQNVDRRRRHVVLNDGNVQWTSAMVFLKKR